MRRNTQVLEATSAQNLRNNLIGTLNNSSFSISKELKCHFLSDLLPYDPQTKCGDRLLAGLKEYDFLLTAAENSADLINKGHISGFDPLVGENACQISAL